jgi:glutamate/tyrosine decarboxylase-like PLP-dependent enzyme
VTPYCHLFDVGLRIDTCPPVSQTISMTLTKKEFQPSLELALQYALNHLDGLNLSSVAATRGLHALRQQLHKPLGHDPIPADQVIRDLTNDVTGGILGSAGGRFFAWVIGGSLPAALAADWLTSAWDQNAALYACAPAAAVIEEIVGIWLKELLGLPASASFALVTGCQMAHTTCLASARHALLARRGWDVEKLGLSGAPPIRILTSASRHGSFLRAIRLLGLGESNIAQLPTDSQDRLQAEALREALAGNKDVPTIVLLQAGDINIGAFDDFELLIPIAKQYGAWVHIDGAFGLWAAASPRFCRLTKGVAAANSWATDGHKWLNVPFDSGFACIADTESHRDSMSHRAAYISHDRAARDQMDWNPEWSRRSRGFAIYAALRQLGRSGVAEIVDRCCQHAHSLATRIGALAGAQLLWTPVINQGLVRFLDPTPGATNEDHDKRTEAVVAAILKSGEAFFGCSTWRGQRVMRVSVCSWQTDEADVDRTVRAVKIAIDQFN